MKSYILVYRSFEPHSFDLTEFITLCKNKKQLDKLCNVFNKQSSDNTFSVREVSVFNNKFNYKHLDQSDINYGLIVDEIFNSSTEEQNYIRGIIKDNASLQTLEHKNSLNNNDLDQIYQYVFSSATEQSHTKIDEILKKIKIIELQGKQYELKNEYLSLKYSL
jgi:hypothetical protein